MGSAPTGRVGPAGTSPPFSPAQTQDRKDMHRRLTRPADLSPSSPTVPRTTPSQPAPAPFPGRPSAGRSHRICRFLRGRLLPRRHSGPRAYTSQLRVEGHGTPRHRRRQGGVSVSPAGPINCSVFGAAGLPASRRIGPRLATAESSVCTSLDSKMAPYTRFLGILAGRASRVPPI